MPRQPAWYSLLIVVVLLGSACGRADPRTPAQRPLPSPTPRPLEVGQRVQFWSARGGSIVLAAATPAAYEEYILSGRYPPAKQDLYMASGTLSYIPNGLVGTLESLDPNVGIGLRGGPPKDTWTKPLAQVRIDTPWGQASVSTRRVWVAVEDVRVPR